ncbi:MAG: hypothetical protein ABIZ80_04525 [Bryobacteraceae bacterium]
MTSIPALPSGSWTLGFLVFEMLCQLATLSPSLAPLRTPLRISTFGASLLLLVLLPARAEPHPAARPAFWAIAILLVSIFHPATNNFISAIAQVAMYLAILAPLFWAARVAMDLRMLRRVFVLIWLFQTASAAVAVLQIAVPGRFEPEIAPVYARLQANYEESIYRRTPSGQRVLRRPTGLTDAPGGASSAGVYAVVLGAGLLLISPGILWKAAAFGGMGAGAICLYLSQVRLSMVVTAVCLFSLLAALIFRGERRMRNWLALTVPAIAAAAFLAAVSVGGAPIAERFATLFADDPSSVYYRNRGAFLEETMTELLPKYPLGAGLGRWGMMNLYFGDNKHPERASLWAEIQWTAWLYDGGLPLILAYLVVIVVACGFVWRLARSPSGDGLWLYAALVLALNVGAVAATFVHPFFLSQGGMELWTLNAAVFAASRDARQS